MKRICFWSMLLIFFSTGVFAKNDLYLSYLTNGNPTALHVAKLRSNMTVETKISKTLSVPGGVTSIVAGDQGKLFIYYSQRPAAAAGKTNTAAPPAKVFRITVTTDPFEFVENSTKVMFNTQNLTNFDVSEHPIFGDRSVREAIALAITEQQLGSLDYRNVNLSNGNLAVPGRWARVEDLPVQPYSVDAARELLEEAGWVLTATGYVTREQAGVLFTEQGTDNEQSYVFTGNDIPYSTVFELCPTPDGQNEKFIYAFRGVTPGSPYPKVNAAIRFIDTDLKPVGNVFVIDPPRVHHNVATAQFNGLAVFPRVESNGGAFLDVVWDRFNTSTNTNDLVARTLQAFNLKPAGGTHMLIRGTTGASTYGLDMTRSREP